MGQKRTGATEVVANRNVTLSTLKGHTIRFYKGIPKMCPNVVLEDAIAIGILPTDDADLPHGKTGGGILPEAAVGSERVRQIREVVQALVDRNWRDDFTASGIPNINTVGDALGYKIEQDELGRVWQTIRQERAESRILSQDEMSGGPERPEDEAELKVALDDAIVSIVETGSEEDYSAAGVPLVRSLKNRLGYEVTEDERDTAWARYNEAKKGTTPPAQSKPKTSKKVTASK